MSENNGRKSRPLKKKEDNEDGKASSVNLR